MQWWQLESNRLTGKAYELKHWGRERSAKCKLELHKRDQRDGDSVRLFCNIIERTCCLGCMYKFMVSSINIIDCLCDNMIFRVNVMQPEQILMWLLIVKMVATGQFRNPRFCLFRIFAMCWKTPYTSIREYIEKWKTVEFDPLWFVAWTWNAQTHNIYFNIKKKVDLPWQPLV